MTIHTKRLILRPWTQEDFEPFAKLNADPYVMEYFPSTLTRQESDNLAQRIQIKIEERGWGWWAVTLKDRAQFIGFIGLNALEPPHFTAHFTPAVEVGWRLLTEYWGQGYATEGALACLEYGFENLHLNEIVSITTTQNFRSMAVMKKIGMQRNPEDDFDHPAIAEGHRLKRHVLYRLKKDEWEKERQ